MQDEIFDKVTRHVISIGEVRLSELQNVFRIGYNRAYRLIQAMVVKGIVSDVAHGSTSRKAIMTLAEYEKNFKGE